MGLAGTKCLFLLFLLFFEAFYCFFIVFYCFLLFSERFSLILYENLCFLVVFISFAIKPMVCLWFSQVSLGNHSFACGVHMFRNEVGGFLRICVCVTPCGLKNLCLGKQIDTYIEREIGRKSMDERIDCWIDRWIGTQRKDRHIDK